MQAEVILWQKIWGWTEEEAVERYNLLKSTKVIWYFDDNRQIASKRILIKE